jgi:hypothetical protein
MFHRSRDLLQAALLQSCQAARQCPAGGGAWDSSSAVGAALRCLSATCTGDHGIATGPPPRGHCSTSQPMPALLQPARQELPGDCSSVRSVDANCIDHGQLPNRSGAAAGMWPRGIWSTDGTTGTL